MSILNRKRMKKRLMKYVEALQALKAYQNSELKLLRVIDNVLQPSKSLSGGKCQVPHCGMSIRYEYVLQSKVTNELLIAGSTCVWELLNLSNSQIKDFGKIEKTIKEFHRMIAWKNQNPDVYDKIMELKKLNVKPFQPFWEEIEYTALEQDDTDYIRKIDVQSEHQKYQAKLARRQQLRSGLSSQSVQPVVVVVSSPVNDSNVSGCDDAQYAKILQAVDYLVGKEPNNTFFQSLKVYSSKKCLTEKQVKAVKKSMNRDYFDKKVATDPNLLNVYNSCDDQVVSLFAEALDNRLLKVYQLDVTEFKNAFSNKNESKLVTLVNKYRKQFGSVMSASDNTQLLWKMFRLKYDIFVS